jgi:hypothetical protein
MQSWPTLNRRQPGPPPPGRSTARTRRWLVVAGVSGALAAAIGGGTAAAVVPGARAAAATAGQPGSPAVISRAPAPFPPVGRSLRASAGGRVSAGAQRRALRTSCRSVAHIGDSTSADLVSPDYLPDPAQRLAARYADVGVRNLRIDASGGRSIVETLPGQVNGYNVARDWRSQGYRGCWVFALGTNDSANVAVGSAVGLTARIDRMMSVAHGEPVLWVNTRTLLSSGDWSESTEEQWNSALARALARYPNMRIFNWAAVARAGWFLSDGIHYTSAGCAARAQAIADALALAFPRAGRSAASVVS